MMEFDVAQLQMLPADELGAGSSIRVRTCGATCSGSDSTCWWTVW